MKKILLVMVSFAILFGIILLPKSASAEDDVTQYATTGKAATNNSVITYFYVTVYSAGASITLHQNEEGLMHWRSTAFYPNETDRYAYAGYVVNYKSVDTGKYAWELPNDNLVADEEFRGKNWVDEDYTLTFKSTGNYIVRISSGANDADKKYAEKWYTIDNDWVTDYWVTAPTWCVSNTWNCQVSSEPTTKKGKVNIYYYKDGKLYDSEIKIIDSNQYFSPKKYDGYTCYSESQYVSLNTTTGNCSPSEIYFYYTKNVGELIIFYYIDNSYYYSETMTIERSQYVTPKTIDGYTCSSESEYVSFDASTGICNPGSLTFFYKKNAGWDNSAQKYNIAISINHYGTDDVWLSGRAEVLSLSPGTYTIKPDYTSTNYYGNIYTLTGTRSYNLTVYSDGSTDKTGFEFYFQKQSKATTPPSNNMGNNLNNSTNNGTALYGLAIQKLATRYGPSTSYAEGGTFFVKGQYIKVLARSYDKVNEIWWVKCEIPDNGVTRILWTGYKRFDSSTLPLEKIPIE